MVFFLQIWKQQHYKRKKVIINKRFAWLKFDWLLWWVVQSLASLLSDPRVLSKLTGTGGLLPEWPFPYSPVFSSTRAHFIAPTHSERQLLSLNKSDKPPWWLLYPIGTQNNMASIRQLQSPCQSGLQRTLKGLARTPENCPVSQLSLILPPTPVPGWCHYWSLWRTSRGVSYHWQLQSLAGSPMRIHDFEAIGLKLQIVLFRIALPTGLIHNLLFLSTLELHFIAPNCTVPSGH